MAMYGQEDTAIFDHLLRNVLDLGNNSPLENALIEECIFQVHDIVSLHASDLGAIKYVDGPNKGMQLLLGDQSCLESLRNYVLCIKSLDSEADLMSTLQHDFDMYRFDPDCFKSHYATVSKSNEVDEHSEVSDAPIA